MSENYRQPIIDAAIANDTDAGRKAVKEWVADFLDRYPQATVFDLRTELTELLFEANRQGIARRG